MKKFRFVLSVMVIAMSVMVCNPAMAQTRKQKKAAEKITKLAGALDGLAKLSKLGGDGLGISKVPGQKSKKSLTLSSWSNSLRMTFASPIRS